MLSIFLLSLLGLSVVPFFDFTQDDRETDGEDDVQPTITGTDGDDMLELDASFGESGATVDGGDGDDILAGRWSDNDTTLNGDDGDDTIYARGDTTANGGAGDDTIVLSDDAVGYGGAGEDYIGTGHSESGEITAWGGDGNDRFDISNSGTAFGENGRDYINLYSGSTGYGDAGDDRIAAEGGSVGYGGAGDDVLVARTGSTVFGDTGDDTIYASDDGSVGYGGEGNDRLYATHNFGVATVYGGAGDDTLSVEHDNVVYGGDGDDFIWAEYGGNTDGGAGNDIIRYQNVIGGTNEATGGEGEDTFGFFSTHSAYNGSVLITDFEPNEDLLVFELPHNYGNASTYAENSYSVSINYDAETDETEVALHTNTLSTLDGSIDYAVTKVTLTGQPDISLDDIGIVLDNGDITTATAGENFELATGTPGDDVFNVDDIDFLSTGDGDDTVTLSVDDVRSSLGTGNGDDTVHATFTDGSSADIETGDGDDTVSLTSAGTESEELEFISVSTGSGDDNVSVDGPIQVKLGGGDGDDTFTATNTGTLSIFGSGGDDVITVDGGTGHQIHGGDDDDIITVSNADKVEIDTGSGMDTVHLNLTSDDFSELSSSVAWAGFVTHIEADRFDDTPQPDDININVTDYPEGNFHWIEISQTLHDDVGHGVTFAYDTFAHVLVWSPPEITDISSVLESYDAHYLNDTGLMVVARVDLGTATKEDSDSEEEYTFDYRYEQNVEVNVDIASTGVLDLKQ